MKIQIQNSTHNFENQDFYIGIDVHKKQWQITIRNDSRELKTYSMNPVPEELYQYLNRNYPGGKYKAVYEAGFSGYWIYRALTELSIDTIVINAADVPTSQKEQVTKTDKVDSRKLARELEKGTLRGIYIPTTEEQSLRSLSRLRYKIVRRQTSIKNWIKAFLNFQGIEIPKKYTGKSYWSKNFVEWLKGINFEHQADIIYLKTSISEFEAQRERLYKLTREIRQICDQIKNCEYIRSVPGVGVIVAFSIFAELCDIRRFKNLDQLASLVGLVPMMRSSGEDERTLGLTYRGNKYLKEMLVEAAWVSVSKDPAMTLAYNELKKRMVGQKAIIKIAKKLLNRIRYCWLNEQYYSLGIVG